MSVEHDSIVSPLSLPRFHGTSEEISAFHTYYDSSNAFYKNWMKDQKETGFVSPLPTIIGYIPEKEREKFTSYVPDHSSVSPYFKSFLTPDKEAFQRLKKTLPETFSLIEQDMELVGLDFDQVVFDRERRYANTEPFADVGKPHIDPITYLIRDVWPTVFADGEVHMENPLHVNLVGNNRIIVAPEFAIVRKLVSTVHWANTPEISTDSTLMSISTKQAQTQA